VGKAPRSISIKITIKMVEMEIIVTLLNNNSLTLVQNTELTQRLRAAVIPAFIHQ